MIIQQLTWCVEITNEQKQINKRVALCEMSQMGLRNHQPNLSLNKKNKKQKRAHSLKYEQLKLKIQKTYVL